MSCPSWDRLVAFRYEGPEGQEPSGWREALEHLDSCAACREVAFAADPTLVFGRLPEERLAPDEAQRMRAGVDALRRASRVESSGRDSARGRWARGERLGGVIRTAGPAVGRLAAAAVLAAALLSAHPDGIGVDGGSLPASFAARQAWVGESPEIGSVLAGDEIDSPTASVYHFDGDDLAITMVVDPDFDV